MAYWKKKTHFLRKDEYICSACGRSSPKAARRCPGCGSRMKKTKSDLNWIDEAEILSALEED
ncbi:MAG: hypothetical protein K6A40_00180 [Solobacterium sp.]|nr:hypothetical protein [Solobacterium sp.]